jgi:hypothetical protein
VATGLDLVSDGEMGEPSFIAYAAQRLDGLEKREGTGGCNGAMRSAYCALRPAAKPYPNILL